MKSYYDLHRATFSDDNIDLASQKISRFLADVGVERREALRMRLILEELLLQYRSEFGEEAHFTLKCVKRLSSVRVELLVPGKAFDPLAKKEDADQMIQNLLSGIGLAPSWSHRRGSNAIVFMSKKKPLSDTVKMLLAIAAALVAGGAITLLPDAVSTGINTYLLTPVTNAFLGLISAVAGPLVFLSILGSICSMGNLETLGRIGSKTIRYIFSRMAVITVLMMGVALLFYPIEQGRSGASDFSRVLDLIYGILPTNLFAPFLSGNALQLIFIAVVLGLAMLVLSSKVSGIFSLVSQCSAIVQTIMGGLSSLLPILIFTLFTEMIGSGKMREILRSGKMIGLILLLLVLYQAANLLYVAVRKRVSLPLLIKKSLPTMMICLTTASSAAAFSTNVHDTHVKLGIDKNLVDFGTPLGQVLFRPGYAAVLVGLELGLAQSCGISITLSWIVFAMISNFFIAFAVPPVPGGMMVGLSIAFAQLGIPLEMMGIGLTVATIIDFPSTAGNVSGWQIALINVADSLNMLDKEVLRSSENLQRNS